MPIVCSALSRLSIPALDNFDALEAIVQWVESGKAPDSLLATGA